VSDDAFWRAIRGRRSVRRYALRPVDTELVGYLLEAAHWAPSAHNRQPWRFVLLDDPATRRRLAEAMAANWQADLLADGVAPEEARRRAALSVHRITGAPVVIIPCLDRQVLDVYPDPQRQLREWQMGVQSVALACQNLLLAAHHLGLVACWMCAPIFCLELVQSMLDLPSTLEPQALLTVGYAAEDFRRGKERAPLATRVIQR
jgi:coenzyme F420-0:L-glutamate ligase / coenzyme F420-1:gamma-L-glutamate ligase